MPLQLAVTVGGSCQPILTAIQDYQPDFVLFLASAGSHGSRKLVDGPDNECSAYGGNIVTQAGLLPDRYGILEINEPDSLALAYEAVRKALQERTNLQPDWRGIADYTGGTKSMTAALVLAALDCGWELSLVVGTRTDLIKALDGSQISSLVEGREILAQRGIHEARLLFNQFAYAEAEAVLNSLLRAGALSPAATRLVQERISLCRGLDAWDRFDHAAARRLLQPFQAQMVPQWIFLKHLTGEDRRTRLEPVLDLVLNARRCAARRRFDDAVARLYRALEMLAQTRLLQLKPAVNTSDVDLASLPAGAQRIFNQPGPDGKIKLGLVRAYELLQALNDPLGLAFAAKRTRLLDALLIRNQSILAHGTRPVSAADWQSIQAEIAGFILAGLEQGLKQMPEVQFPILNESGDFEQRKDKA